MTGRSRRRWWYGSVLLGFLGGVVWWAVAKPPYWVITAQGATMTEGQSRHEFGAIVSFVVIGAVLCFAFGVVLTLKAGEHWSLVPAVAALSGFASVITWLVGKMLGPDGPSKEHLPPVGTHVPEALSIGTAAPFVAWAAFGVAGVLFGTWLLHHRSRPRAEAVPD